jgi:hypothetical protein
MKIYQNPDKLYNSGTDDLPPVHNTARRTATDEGLSNLPFQLTNPRKASGVGLVRV